MDQGICGFPSSLSPEAFPGGFPTGLSHVPPWWESILGMKGEAVEQNRFLRNGLRHLRDSWNGDTTLELLSPFLWRAPPLQMLRERWECFPDQAGKGSLISSYEAETGPSGCGRDPRASSRVETGMSGNFLNSSKGVKDLLEVPGFRCD